MEIIMKAQGIAILPRLADLHPGRLAPAPVARRAPRPSLWQRLAAWSRVAHERRRLLELDTHILRDIGLTPEEAHREASRPFWDLDDRR
jgi:uncharacterized protein YjiS (DUF1127 family)